MLASFPIEFWLMAGAMVFVLAVSAFFLGSPVWWQRGMARSCLVVSGTGIFVATMTYVSTFVAVLALCAPLALFIIFITGSI